MLSNHDSIKRDQLLPPSDHLVGKLRQRLIFSFSFDLVKDMYSEVGSPSLIQLFYKLKASHLQGGF
ncbi:hypothetical protein [Peribacillus frigoritolerans]